MRRKLDKVGKIAGGTAILALVVVGIVAYLGYGWYQQHIAASGTGITWTAVLENGDEIPITGATTFYASPQTLALYTDSNYTTRITGVKCHIWVTANTTATTTGNATLSGTWRQTVVQTSTNTIVNDSGVITLSNQTAPPNTKTEIATWDASVGGQIMTSWVSGYYDIIENFTITGVVPIAGGSVSGSGTAAGDMKVYWSHDTLGIVPEFSWTTLSIS